MTDTTETTADARTVANRLVPLYRWMDGAGLLLLGWAVVLAWLGRPGQRPPGADQVGAAGPASSLHTWGLLAAVAVTVPLVVVVLASYGLPRPGRSRGRWALPAIASLGAALVLPLIAGHPGLSNVAGATAAPVAWRGGWDDAATGLAAAGVAMLVVRPARLSAGPRWAAIGGSLASGVASLTLCFGFPAGLGSPARPSDYLLVSGIPLSVVALAVVLAIGLVRSAPWAAGGLFIWGLATACQFAVPRGLPSGTWPSAGVIDGPAAFTSLTAGAAAGGAVCAGSVLVTQIRRRRDPARRHDPRRSQLRGALCVSAVLAAMVFAVPLTYLAALGAGPSVLTEIWVVLLPISIGLIGCALMMAAGLRLASQRVRKVLPMASLGTACIALAQITTGLVHVIRPPGESWPAAATITLDPIRPITADVASPLIVVPLVVMIMLLRAARGEGPDTGGAGLRRPGRRRDTRPDDRHPPRA